MSTVEEAVVDIKTLPTSVHRSHIRGDAEYVDWCSPHKREGGSVVGTAYGVGLNLTPNPDHLVKPIPKVLCAFPGLDYRVLNNFIQWMERCGADVSIDHGPSLLSSQMELDGAIKMTQVNLAQKRYYIGPIDPNYINYLTESKIDFALIHPPRSSKSKWRALLKQQGWTPDMIKILMDRWDMIHADLLDFSLGLAQRFLVTVENNELIINDVPEYLKPESPRTLYHLVGRHAQYEFNDDGEEVKGREPLMMVKGELYGRVLEHRIPLIKLQGPRK